MKRFSYMFMAILMSINLMQVPVYATEIDNGNDEPVVEENQNQENPDEEDGVPANTSNNDGIITNESENEELVVTETIEYCPNGEEDNDRLFNEYVNRAFGIQEVSAPTTRMRLRSASVSRGSLLTGFNKKVYDYLKTQIEAVASGQISSTEFVMDINELGVANAEYEGEWNETNRTALRNQCFGDFNWETVLNSLISDCPYELYWYNKTTDATVGQSYSYTTNSSGKIVFGTETQFTFSFPVSNEYQANNQVYSVNNQVATISAAVANAQNIVNENSTLSDYEKLVAYKNIICEMTSYNDDAANENTHTPYGNPWNLIYVFDGDPNTKVVCEGYSKAFKYLCDKSSFSGNIECYTVTGTMSGGTGAGPHMWNSVTMGDGKWYLVDVTNCDDGTVGAPDQLFLKGYNSYTGTLDFGNGVTEQQYGFTVNNNDTITYYYDADTVNLYHDTGSNVENWSILGLSNSNYSPAEQVLIQVSKKDESGNEITGNVSGLGEYMPGNTLTLTAPVVNGYDFVGWYNYSDSSPYHTDDVLCGSNMYTFTVTSAAHYTAVYKARPVNANVTIIGGNSYTINGTNSSGSVSQAYAIGTSVTVATDDANFEYWKNSYGMVLSRSNSYTFNVSGSDTVEAVFTNNSTDTATIIFESDSGQVMGRLNLASGQSGQLPVLPTKYGYTISGWDLDGNGSYDSSSDTLAAAISRGLQETNHTVTVRAVYVLGTNTYTINVTGGTGTGTYSQDQLVTATANTPTAGKKFSHWRDVDNNILCYNSTYQFKADRNLSLVAVYVDQSAEVNAIGTTSIIHMEKDPSRNALIFVSLSSVPEGCTIEKAGVLATSNATIGQDAAAFTDTANDVLVRTKPWTGNTYRLTWTKANVTNGDTWYVRAYLVYKDNGGNSHTVCGPIVSQTYN